MRHLLLIATTQGDACLIIQCMQRVEVPASGKDVRCCMTHLLPFKSVLK